MLAWWFCDIIPTMHSTHVQKFASLLLTPDPAQRRKQIPFVQTLKEALPCRIMYETENPIPSSFLSFVRGIILFFKT